MLENLSMTVSPLVCLLVSVFHTKYLNNCYIDIRININNYDDLKYQFIVSQSDFV